jgi:two-component system nitrate/nitrite response regulator NarP
MLTLMIVDDHPLMRRGIRQLLTLEPRLEVVAEANNGTEALAEARRLTPDVILLDLNMKGMSGLDTLKALRHEGISSRILVLTVSDARSDIYAMVDAGADGYLLKDSDPDMLLSQIMQAAQGKKFSVKRLKIISLRVNTVPIRFAS